MKYLHLAAKQNYEEAHRNLGWIYHFGCSNLEIKRNHNLAASYYLSANKLVEGSTVYFMLHLYRTLETPTCHLTDPRVIKQLKSTLFNYYHSCQEKTIKDPVTLVTLSYFHSLGVVVAKDEQKAIELLRTIDGNYPTARYELYRLLILKSPVEAISLLKENEKENHLLSLSELGRMYLDGNEFIPKNVNKALSLLKQSSQVELSCYHLGMYYKQKNLMSKARQWFRKGNNILIGRSTFELAKLYAKGDCDRFVKLLARAVEFDCPEALEYMANSYEELGDLERAREYNLRAESAYKNLIGFM